MSGEFTLDSDSTNEANEILGRTPEPQEHAIAAASKTMEGVPPETETTQVDDFGTVFDPEKHTGTKTKNGAWRSKKQKSVVATSRKNSSATPAATPTAQVDSSAEAMATGQVIATLFLGACQSIGGEEWEPTKQERDFQVSAWQAYCVAKDVKELSPGLALLIAIGSYAGARVGKPKTAAKIGRLKTWIGLRVAKWKIKKELAKRGIKANVTIEDSEIHINGTRADSWNDGIGQNN